MKRISAREAVGLGASAAIIDVREDDEYAAGHVVGSVNIPLSCFVDRIDQVPVGTPVYVICASGNRSAKVTEYLAARDYDATNIDGGIIAWSGYGGPVASGASGIRHPLSVYQTRQDAGVTHGVIREAVFKAVSERDRAGRPGAAE